MDYSDVGCEGDKQETVEESVGETEEREMRDVVVDGAEGREWGMV